MPDHKRPSFEKLTDRQTEVYRYLVEFFEKNDQLPPTREVGRHFGILQNGARSHLMALERKGFLDRNKLGRLRFSRYPYPIIE